MKLWNTAMKDYVTSTSPIIIGYVLLTTLFYVINFFFFGDAIDVPADLVFSLVYIIVIPGVVTLLTLLKGDINQIIQTKEYVYNILIHGLVPIIISIVFSTLYFSLDQGSDDWYRIVLLHGFSFPIVFAGIIVAHEFHLKIPNILKRAIILIILILSYFILSKIFDSYALRYVNYTITALYLYIGPFLLIVLWYRKQLLGVFS